MVQRPGFSMCSMCGTTLPSAVAGAADTSSKAAVDTSNQKLPPQQQQHQETPVQPKEAPAATTAVSRPYASLASPDQQNNDDSSILSKEETTELFGMFTSIYLANSTDHNLDTLLVNGNDNNDDDANNDQEPPRKRQKVSRHNQRNAKLEALDASLARKLQEEEERQEREHQERKEKEQAAMHEGVTGRAYLLVEKVLQKYCEILEEDPALKEIAKQGQLETVGRDDMVYLAEKMMVCQADFQKQQEPESNDGDYNNNDDDDDDDSMACLKGGISSHASEAQGREEHTVQSDSKSRRKSSTVEIAYHYTVEERMHNIRQDGLLTRSNLRDSRKSTSAKNNLKMQARHGARYGNGIYTGDNPYAFCPYGDTGLLVAILKGTERRIKSTETLSEIERKEANTVIGNKFDNKGDRSVGFDEIVLRESCQVLPLIRYSRSMIETGNGCCHVKNAGNALLWRFHNEMQALLDDCFRNLTPVVPVHTVPHPASMASVVAAVQRRNQLRVTTVGPVFGPAASVIGRRKLTRPSNPISRGDFMKTLFGYLRTEDRVIYEKLRVFCSNYGHENNSARIRARKVCDIVGMEHWSKVLEKLASSHSAAARPPCPVALAQNQQSSSVNRIAPGTSTKATATSAHKTVSFTGLAASSKRKRAPTSLAGTTNHVTFATQQAQPATHTQHTSSKPSRVTMAYTGCIPYTAPEKQDSTEPHGQSPPGVMTTRFIDDLCSGFESTSKGSFGITYSIPTGTQHSCHENPGKKYKAQVRNAYLPNNDEGKSVLRRLKWAWTRGLIFTIGTSQATGKRGRVVWSSIPHKTSRVGIEHAFPDPTYFRKCNDALDKLKVPAASLLSCDGIRHAK